MIVSDPLSIWYLTGVHIDPYERLYVLYLRTDGRHLFFLNHLFVIPDVDIDKKCFSDTDDCIGILASHVDATSDMGIDKNWASGYLLALMDRNRGIGYRNASFCIDRVRAVKDMQEQDKMRASSHFNDVCMDKVTAFMKEGMSERECADYVRSLYKEAGCEEGFDTIISFGTNAADPHHVPDDTRLKPGDCIVIDMGCRMERYSSDMTRTWFCGTPTEKQIAVHNLVREAGELAEQMIKPGVRFCDIDKTSRDLISKAGYGRYFNHRLGHSIGLVDHEPGDVSLANQDVIREGMTFSIEPGVYIPGEFGVRIEDLVLVTAGDCEVLNCAGKLWKSIG